MRRLIALASLVVVGAVIAQVAVGQRDAAEPAGPAEPVMQAKLGYSRNLFLALAREDYASLASNARALQAATRLAEWQKPESPDYQADSVDFERATMMLAEAAKAKNADRAALATLEVTMTCIDCHGRLRDSGEVTLSGVNVDPAKPVTPSKETSVWMLRKLQWSEDVLASLIAEDYAALKSYADAMQTLNKVEGWVRGKKLPDYETHLAVFDYACRTLSGAAAKKDFDRAKLGFAQLTLACVNCHSDLRKPPRD